MSQKTEAKTEAKVYLNLEKFEGIARHIEGTDLCMLTLPCKFTDKKVIFTVELAEA